MTNRIEKTIDLTASPARVWTALTDSAEFSAWFNVLFVDPFVPGQTAHGTVTYPGYEGSKCDLNILAKQELRRFAFSWHPHAIDPERDYSTERATTVEFTMEEKDDGTRLTVVESGFDALPPDRASEAYEAHLPGWEMQLDNIAAHVSGRPKQPS